MEQSEIRLLTHLSWRDPLLLYSWTIPVPGPVETVVGSTWTDSSLTGSMILGTGPDRSKKVHNELWSAVEVNYNLSNALSHGVLVLLPRAVATRERQHSRARRNSPVILARNELFQQDHRVSVCFRCQRI